MRYKTLAEQIGERCKYYNGLSGRGMRDDSTTRCCDAGVVYLTVKSTDESRKGFDRFPCFREGEGVPCEKRHFPTAEEVAAEVAEHNASWERLKLGIAAAGDDAKKRGLGKGKGGAGVTTCPVCKTGELHYTVAGYNGHMWGRCSTKDCVSWAQ